MKLLFSAFRNIDSSQRIYFAKGDILKPNEAELQMDSRFTEKVEDVLKFINPDTLKGDVDDAVTEVLNKIPGKITKKEQAEEFKKAIASSEAFQEALLAKEIQKSQEFFENEKAIGLFVENESLFHKSHSPDPYASFQAFSREILQKEFRREPFTDEEWAVMLKALEPDLKKFYEKANDAHPEYCVDDKAVDQEKKILGKLIDTEKAGETLWLKHFNSPQEMFDWWKEQPQIKKRLEKNKGKRKERIEAELLKLVEQEISAQQAKHVDYCDDEKALNREKEILKKFIDPKKAKKEFWNQAFSSPEELMEAWKNDSPALVERLESAKGNRKEALEAFLLEIVTEQFQANAEKQNLKIKDQLKKSQEIFEEAQAKYTTPEFQKTSIEEIEEHLQKDLKKANLFDSFPPKSQEKKEIYSQILDDWEAVKTKIESSKIDQAQQLIKNIDFSSVDMNDPRNEDFSFFVKNFSETIFFDDATWKAVADTAYKKFGELHKAYLSHLENDTDTLSRKDMAQKWEKFLGKMNSYSMDFDSLEDFEAQFVDQSFEGKNAQLKAYFEAHPNFSKAFRQSFEAYQVKQKEHFESEFFSTVKGISDPQIRKGMERSFATAKDMKQRREWLKYAEKHAPLYEISLQKNRKTERDVSRRLQALEGNPEVEKISGNFEHYKNVYELNKGVYEERKFVSPRVYADQLSEIESQLKGIEKAHEKSIQESEKGIQNIALSDLDNSSLYKNFDQFKQQPFFREIVSFPDHIWKKVQPTFEAHAARLWAEQLKTQNGDEKIPENSESSQAVEDIAKLSAKDLDFETDWKSFEAFKRQPKVQEKISYSDKVWQAVNESHFQPKMAELYAEYLEKSQEKPENAEWKSDIENMSLGDISNIDDPKLLDKGVLAKEFDIWMPDDVWESEGKALFSAKLDELHEELTFAQKNPENSEFSKEDIRALGSKHGLNFHNIVLRNTKNLAHKFGRLEEMIKKSDSFKRMLRGNEAEMIPFFLGFLGEMNDSEMKKTLTDIGSGYKTFDELSENIFGNDRRRYLANKARKENFHSWNKLSQGERRMKNEKISEILLNKEQLDEAVEEGVLPEALDLPEESQEISSVEGIETGMYEDELDEDLSGDDMDEKTEKSQEFFEEDISSEGDEEFKEDLGEDMDPRLRGDEGDVDGEGEDLDSEEDEEGRDSEMDEENDVDGEGEGTFEDEEVDPRLREDEEVVDEGRSSQEGEKSQEFFEEEGEEDENSDQRGNEGGFEREEEEENPQDVQEDERKDPQIFWEQYQENGMRLGDLLDKVGMYASVVWNTEIQIDKKIPENLLKARVKDSEGFFSKIAEHLVSQKIPEILSVVFSYENGAVGCVVQKSFGIARKSVSVDLDT